MHPRRSFLPILLVLWLLFASTACSTFMGSSSPVVDRIQKSGELRIGMTGDYPPLNMVDRNGESFGLEPDLAKALAQSMNVELVVVNKTFQELLAALESGEVDAVMSGMGMTPERNMKVAFVGPYFVSGKAVLTKSATLARARSMSDLNPARLRMSVLAGSTSQAFLSKAAPSAKVTATPTTEAAIQLVIDGGVDAMFADHASCMLAVLRHPEAGLSTVVSPLSFEPIGMALPANDPLLVNIVQNYMTTLEGTGLLEQLRERWFEDPSWLERLP
ncbi:MAG: transporter substrate-binding domain-containing protein [Myxococcota bacterium]